MAQLIPSPH